VGRIAPELNGARLFTPGQHQVWLVYHGTRHHITGPGVFDALFSDGVPLTAMEDVGELQRGADLVDGTCLVRAEGDMPIFLVTGFPDTEVRKHHIVSYESFMAFGFDEAKVRLVPRLVLAAIPLGRELRSAAG
jgi:hypothetical protein